MGHKGIITRLKAKNKKEALLKYNAMKYPYNGRVEVLRDMTH